MGVIPNPKMAFIFPISCILALIFPILIKYFPKCVGKGSFPKSQIKSLYITICIGKFNNLHWKQSKFLLVLQHEALAMASGRGDFSSFVICSGTKQAQNFREK